MDSAEALLCEKQDSDCLESQEPSIELVEGRERMLTKKEQRCLLAHQEAWGKEQSSVAVAKLFSPPRFTTMLEKTGEQGLAFDINQGWDLTDPKTQKEVDQKLDDTKPELPVCCPECKHWGG